MECQKVKSKADCDKNWAKLIKYANCIQVYSKPLKILPPRGLRGNKKEQNVNMQTAFMYFLSLLRFYPSEV